ncbi:MAG: hypothetical protein GVY36_15495 [Verrucomicrobia bacterium]|nr:hypothetical protein [Verrucomicrobiota bacterium]
MDAQLIELKEAESIVTIKLRDGRQIDASVSAFSEADQEHIQKWWAGVEAEKQLLKERARLTISAKMNRQSNRGTFDRHSRVDDKTRVFYPEVVIENGQLQTYTGNTIRVVVVAEDLSEANQKLIVSATTMKADFPKNDRTVLESDPFRLRSYAYNSGRSSRGYKYGYEYEGYIVVIKNSEGEITHTRASKSKYLTNMQVIMGCKAGEIYDDSIDRKLELTPNSYYVQ